MHSLPVPRMGPCYRWPEHLKCPPGIAQARSGQCLTSPAHCDLCCVEAAVLRRKLSQVTEPHYRRPSDRLQETDRERAKSDEQLQPYIRLHDRDLQSISRRHVRPPALSSPRTPPLKISVRHRFSVCCVTEVMPSLSLVSSQNQDENLTALCRAAAFLIFIAPIDADRSRSPRCGEYKDHSDSCEMSEITVGLNDSGFQRLAPEEARSRAGAFSMK